MNVKMFNGNNLPHELLLTRRQKAKLRNAFENNMSLAIKLSKAQISKIVQSRRFLGSLLSKIACPLMKLAAPLPKETTWFWSNNFNNFKRRNEWYNKNCSSSERLKYFIEGSYKSN